MLSRPFWRAAGSLPACSLTVTERASAKPCGRWHMNLVLPMARLLEDELSEKLEAPVKLTFDGYPKDLQARASTFQRLVDGGVAVTEALTVSGLLLTDG